MTASLRIGLMPYLNSEPFYRYLRGSEYVLTPLVPTAMARAAEAGDIVAGPVPLVDCFRLEESFEPLDGFCIAVRDKARSILLFARRPIEQLGGAAIAVSGETSTSARLLKVLLAHFWRVTPGRYTTFDQSGVEGPGLSEVEGDAYLLIGDAALKGRRGAAGYTHCYDLAEVWHEWTGLPFVFARWIVARSLPQREKQRLIEAIDKSVREETADLPAIARRRADLGLSEREVIDYLQGFSYLCGERELRAAELFREMLGTLKEEKVSSGR